MIAIIFEVEPADGQYDTYLGIAADLRETLEQVDGFISVERFRSLASPGKLLSLSFFEDEVAVLRWRKLAAHRVAQERGRSGVFRDYRLRVADVTRDYGLRERAEAPVDSVLHHG